VVKLHKNQKTFKNALKMAGAILTVFKKMYFSESKNQKAILELF